MDVIILRCLSVFRNNRNDEQGSVIDASRHSWCSQRGVDISFHVDYEGYLGKGTKTTVREAKRRKTGKKFAVKSVQKKHKEEFQAMKDEALILRQLHHPHIIKVLHVRQDETMYCLVLELCTGKELYEEVAKLAEKNQTTIKERFAVQFVRQLVQAVSYCHGKGIVHRDIKLENVANNSKNYKKKVDIRLFDFGLATRLEPGTYLNERVGSPQYVAPEVLNGKYNEKCDIWSIGVLSYALLCAEAPFAGRTKEETYEKIQNSEVSFHQKTWQTISEPAKDFIRVCLEKDPVVRPAAEKLLTTHEWLQNPPPPVAKKKIFKLFSKTST